MTLLFQNCATHE